MVPAAFADARIPYDSIEIHSSPRRLIVMAYGVADATEALVEEYKGPAAKIAFDADGNPTKAAIGFARGKGLSPESLERREVNGTEYVFATKNIPATPVADLLPDVLAGFITAIKWPRSCRWGRISRVLRAPGALDRGHARRRRPARQLRRRRVRLTSPWAIACWLPASTRWIPPRTCSTSSAPPT